MEKFAKCAVRCGDDADCIAGCESDCGLRARVGSSDRKEWAQCVMDGTSVEMYDRLESPSETGDVVLRVMGTKMAMGSSLAKP